MSGRTIGWRDLTERSMMLRRRWASAHTVMQLEPGAIRPRGAMASIIFEMAMADGCWPSNLTSPQIPHTVSDPPSVVSLQLSPDTYISNN